MGTRALAFFNILLMLKVVTAFNAAFQVNVPIPQSVTGGNANADTGDKMARLPLEKTPLPVEGLKVAQNSNNQIITQHSTTSLQKNAMEETNDEIKLSENDIHGSSQVPSSGAGDVETNEIVKYTDAPSKVDVFDNDNVILNAQTGNAQLPTEDRSFKQPELDKAVEDAINKLPPSDESPLVPLIKIFNRRIDELSTDKDAPKDFDRFVQKNIVLKLAKKVNELNEANRLKTEVSDASKTGVENAKENHVENHDEGEEGQFYGVGCGGGEVALQDDPEEQNVKNQDVPEEEGSVQDFNEPEVVGCGNASPDDTMPSDQESQKEGDGFQANNQNPLRRAIIVLKLHRPEYTTVKQNNPSIRFSSFRNEQSTQPNRNQQLRPIFMRISKGLVSTNNDGKSNQENERRPFSMVLLNRNRDNNSEFPSVFSMIPHGTDNQDQGMTDEEQLHKLLSKELTLLKLLNNLMKKTNQNPSAASLEDQLHQKAMSVHSELSSNDIMSQFMAFKPRDNLPNQDSGIKREHIIEFFQHPIVKQLFQSFSEAGPSDFLNQNLNFNVDQIESFLQLPIFKELTKFDPKNNLPPVKFPAQDSGFNVKHLQDFINHPSIKQLMQSGSENEPNTIFNLFNEFEDDESNEDSAPEDVSMDIPKLIKNMLGDQFTPVNSINENNFKIKITKTTQDFGTNEESDQNKSLPVDIPLFLKKVLTSQTNQLESDPSFQFKIMRNAQDANEQSVQQKDGSKETPFLIKHILSKLLHAVGNGMQF